MLLCMPLGHTADQRTRDIATKDYIEIHCSLSGGMKQVIFDRYLFKFIETVEKESDSPLKSGSLDSFVEIQKRTRLDKSQEKRLRDWIIKHKISEVKIVPPPEKEPIGMAETRYANNLMIYIDSMEYSLNHYTIDANPKLWKAFDELFGMAKEFTAAAKSN